MTDTAPPVGVENCSTNTQNRDPVNKHHTVNLMPAWGNKVTTCVVLTHLSKSNSRTFQGAYKRYIRKTELNQTDTFMSISKQVQFTFDNLTPSSINQKLDLSEISVSNSNDEVYSPLRLRQHWFWKSLVQSRRFRRSNSSTFKDLQTLSKTMSVFKDFPGLENLEKNSKTFKNMQEPCTWPEHAVALWQVSSCKF